MEIFCHNLAARSEKDCGEDPPYAMLTRVARLGVAMRAMLLEKPKPAEENPLRAADVPLPVPGAGEIRVRVSACAVCHTDLHIVESDIPLPQLPIVPGHQIVGVVDALGEGAQQFRGGERVGIPWLYSTCGECA